MQKIIYTLAIMFLITSLCIAQNISSATVKWNSSQTFNSSEGIDTSEVTAFLTYGKNRMEWKNADGSIRKSFQVIELIGEWANVNSTGQLQYEVSDGQYSGTITLRRTDKEIRITLAMATSEPSITELTIETIQVL